jgi:hypothetical protein
MTVIKNEPLPAGHPLKNGLIVLGKERSTPSGSKLVAVDSTAGGKEPNQEELAASNLYERLVKGLSKE